MREARAAALALAALLGLAADCSDFAVLSPSDPVDPATGRAFELLPGISRFEPGPDGIFGTADDIVDATLKGDVDLIVRASATAPDGRISVAPPELATSSPPLGVAGALGSGVPLPYSVLGWASDPATGAGFVVGYDLDAVPIVAAAFADLDGDGFIGITNLDGTALDAQIEEAELAPVARRLSIASGPVAHGNLAIAAGGPAGAPLRVLIAAAAYVGPIDPAFQGGHVPDGPAVFTNLPYLPRSDPSRVIQAGPGGPGAATPDVLVALEIRREFTPDPTDPRYGEDFTLMADGSEPTLDGGDVLSGAASRHGAIQIPDPASYQAIEGRPLRPGLDGGGARALFEVLRQLHVPDDGAGSPVAIRVVPLDRLGNIADPLAPALVHLRTSPGLRILAPETDGDPTRETVQVDSAGGIAVWIDDSGGSFDDPDPGFLDIWSGSEPARINVVLPDPDVDDSGLVDALDIAAIQAVDLAQIGDPDYDRRLDQNGDGRIDIVDQNLVQAEIGRVVSVP